MKWNVEEANPKTGQYRTLSVDAPDPEAAEALGKFMGLSASDVAHRQSRLSGEQTLKPRATPGAIRARLATHWIVLLTVGVTLLCTVAAVWVARSLTAPAVVSPTPAANAVDDGETDRGQSEVASDGKPTEEASDVEPVKATTSDDVKPPDERIAQDDSAHQ